MAEIQADMARFGFSEEAQKAAMHRHTEPIRIERWNLETVRAFNLVDLHVQWGMDGPHYVGVQPSELVTVCGIAGIVVDESLLWGVRVMAAEACRVHNKSIQRPPPPRRGK